MDISSELEAEKARRIAAEEALESERTRRLAAEQALERAKADLDAMRQDNVLRTQTHSDLLRQLKHELRGASEDSSRLGGAELSALWALVNGAEERGTPRTNPGYKQHYRRLSLQPTVASSHAHTASFSSMATQSSMSSYRVASTPVEAPSKPPSLTSPKVPIGSRAHSRRTLSVDIRYVDSEAENFDPRHTRTSSIRSTTSGSSIFSGDASRPPHSRHRRPLSLCTSSSIFDSGKPGMRKLPTIASQADLAAEFNGEVASGERISAESRTSEGQITEEQDGMMPRTPLNSGFSPRTPLSSGYARHSLWEGEAMTGGDTNRRRSLLRPAMGLRVPSAGSTGSNEMGESYYARDGTLYGESRPLYAGNESPVPGSPNRAYHLEEAALKLEGGVRGGRAEIRVVRGEESIRATADDTRRLQQAQSFATLRSASRTNASASLSHVPRTTSGMVLAETATSTAPSTLNSSFDSNATETTTGTSVLPPTSSEMVLSSDVPRSGSGAALSRGKRVAEMTQTEKDSLLQHIDNRTALLPELTAYVATLVSRLQSADIASQERRLKKHHLPVGVEMIAETNLRELGNDIEGLKARFKAKVEEEQRVIGGTVLAGASLAAATAAPSLANTMTPQPAPPAALSPTKGGAHFSSPAKGGLTTAFVSPTKSVQSVGDLESSFVELSDGDRLLDHSGADRLRDRSVADRLRDRSDADRLRDRSELPEFSSPPLPSAEELFSPPRQTFAPPTSSPGTSTAPSAGYRGQHGGRGCLQNSEDRENRENRAQRGSSATVARSDVNLGKYRNDASAGKYRNDVTVGQPRNLASLGSSLGSFGASPSSSHLTPPSAVTRRDLFQLAQIMRDVLHEAVRLRGIANRVELGHSPTGTSHLKSDAQSASANDAPSGGRGPPASLYATLFTRLFARPDGEAASSPNDSLSSRTLAPETGQKAPATAVPAGVYVELSVDGGVVHSRSYNRDGEMGVGESDGQGSQGSQTLASTSKQSQACTSRLHVGPGEVAKTELERALPLPPHTLPAPLRLQTEAASRLNSIFAGAAAAKHAHPTRTNARYPSTRSPKPKSPSLKKKKSHSKMKQHNRLDQSQSQRVAIANRDYADRGGSSSVAGVVPARTDFDPSGRVGGVTAKTDAPEKTGPDDTSSAPVTQASSFLEMLSSLAMRERGLKPGTMGAACGTPPGRTGALHDTITGSKLALGSGKVALAPALSSPNAPVLTPVSVPIGSQSRKVAGDTRTAGYQASNLTSEPPNGSLVDVNHTASGNTNPSDKTPPPDALTASAHTLDRKASAQSLLRGQSLSRSAAKSTVAPAIASGSDLPSLASAYFGRSLLTPSPDAKIKQPMSRSHWV